MPIGIQSDRLRTERPPVTFCSVARVCRRSWTRCQQFLRERGESRRYGVTQDITAAERESVSSRARRHSTTSAATSSVRSSSPLRHSQNRLLTREVPTNRARLRPAWSGLARRRLNSGQRDSARSLSSTVRAGGRSRRSSAAVGRSARTRTPPLRRDCGPDRPRREWVGRHATDARPGRQQRRVLRRRQLLDDANRHVRTGHRPRCHRWSGSSLSSAPRSWTGGPDRWRWQV